MAEDALCFQLRKAFKSSNQSLGTLTDTVKLGMNTLSNLSNLSEQYCCCDRVDLELTGLNHSPDVKQRTLNKIQGTMEKHMTRLWEDAAVLEGLSEKVTEQHETTKDLYNRHGNELGINLMTAGDPMRPSYADMMQYLNDLDNAFHFEYVKRWNLLKQVDYSDGDTVVKLQGWSDTGEILQSAKFIMGQMQFFMDEQK